MVEKYRNPKAKTLRSQWFHGTLGRQEAERIIKSHSDNNGTFLVRYSDRNKGQFVLTLLNESLFYHYIICKSVSILNYQSIAPLIEPPVLKGFLFDVLISLIREI